MIGLATQPREEIYKKHVFLIATTPPRASVYHGLAYFGDFRPPKNDDDYGIPMVIIMGFHYYGIKQKSRAGVAIPRERHYVTGVRCSQLYSYMNHFWPLKDHRADVRKLFALRGTRRGGFEVWMLSSL